MIIVALRRNCRYWFNGNFTIFSNCVDFDLLGRLGNKKISKQKRIGFNKKIFTIYKIRTLKRNSPQVGTHEMEDHYKLTVGRIVRTLKLDEFPQLFNVIRGDLNLIGPRPGLESQLALEEARMVQGVFETKPGITGLAQVLGYDMSTPEMLAKVDKLYVNHKSMKLNTIIFLGTFFKYPRT